MIRKIGANFQLAIPRDIIKALHLEQGSLVDIRVENGEIRLIPQVILPRGPLEPPSAKEGQ